MPVAGWFPDPCLDQHFIGWVRQQVWPGTGLCPYAVCESWARAGTESGSRDSLGLSPLPPAASLCKLHVGAKNEAQQATALVPASPTPLVSTSTPRPQLGVTSAAIEHVCLLQEPSGSWLEGDEIACDAMFKFQQSAVF